MFLRVFQGVLRVSEGFSKVSEGFPRGFEGFFRGVDGVLNVFKEVLKFFCFQKTSKTPKKIPSKLLKTQIIPPKPQPPTQPHTASGMAQGRRV